MSDIIKNCCHNEFNEVLTDKLTVLDKEHGEYLCNICGMFYWDGTDKEYQCKKTMLKHRSRCKECII